MTGIEFARLARRVREALGQRHRTAHVLRVARTAALFARLHGVDVARARIAGMLHDLARLWDAQRLLAECERRGMPVDAFERDNPIVLHARLGAELAREEFGITDAGILHAIAAHTVGAPAMSDLDAVVYLADGLEPGRDFADRAGLFDLAAADLNAAMRAVLSNSMAYLEARGQAVAPQTLAAARAYGLDMPRETHPV